MWSDPHRHQSSFTRISPFQPLSTTQQLVTELVDHRGSGRDGANEARDLSQFKMSTNATINGSAPSTASIPMMDAIVNRNAEGSSVISNGVQSGVGQANATAGSSSGNGTTTAAANVAAASPTPAATATAPSTANSANAQHPNPTQQFLANMTPQRMAQLMHVSGPSKWSVYRKDMILTSHRFRLFCDYRKSKTFVNRE